MMLHKRKLDEKTVDFYPLYVRLFGFYTQQNVNSAANFVLETGLPRVVVVLPWVLFVRSLRNIFTVAIPGQKLAR